MELLRISPREAGVTLGKLLQYQKLNMLGLKNVTCAKEILETIFLTPPFG